VNKGLILFLTIVVLAVYPPMTVLVERGAAAAFQFFAADSMTYLAVAKNSQGKPFFTFDGQNPTTGFHPLWQWLLAWPIGALAAGNRNCWFCGVSRPGWS